MHRARSRAELLALAHGELFLWLTAVRLQRDRAFGPHPLPEVADMSDTAAAGVTMTSESQADSIMFALALRNLLRAAEWVAKQEPKAQAAVDRFHAAVPESVDVRDLLEHFDDYIEGEGKLQNPDPKKRRGKPQLQSYAVFFESSVSSSISRRILYVGDWTIDVAVAADAATQMVEELFAALETP